MTLVSLENVKNVFWVVAQLPKRLKSTLLEIFFSLHWLRPLGPLHSKKNPTTLILAFEANSALFHENETKIVKIKHSAASWHHHYHHHQWKITNQDSQQSPIFFANPASYPNYNITTSMQCCILQRIAPLITYFSQITNIWIEYLIGSHFR